MSTRRSPPRPNTCASLGVGALPICGDDDRLHGMITDRDIVIKCIAAGQTPTPQPPVSWPRAAPIMSMPGRASNEMLSVMEEHQVRRLPVIDNHRLVGMVSEADIARHLPEHAIAAVRQSDLLTPGHHQPLIHLTTPVGCVGQRWAVACAER